MIWEDSTLDRLTELMLRRWLYRQLDVPDSAPEVVSLSKDIIERLAAQKAVDEARSQNADLTK